ncbi:NUDIX domain-containing protein [Bacteroidota bacterium]
MDELIELLDQNGQPNGKSCLKSIAHQQGLFHASVHIWFYTKVGEVLLQKRKHTKQTFPSLWDVSVAGHISFGEKELISAIREIEEEIGLVVNPEALTYLGTSQHKNKHSKNLIDHELHHIYISELKVPFSNLTIQESEVEEIKLLSINEFQNELTLNSSYYVPHGSKYYARIINSILKELTKL